MSSKELPAEDRKLLDALEPCERLVLENWALGGHETGLFQETSFLSLLHETHGWSEEAYWQFDKALVEVANKYEGQTLPRLLLRALMDLFIQLNGKLAHHRMPGDLWQIDNMTDEESCAWSERVEGLFRAAITGDVFRNKDWEPANPLLG